MEITGYKSTASIKSHYSDEFKLLNVLVGISICRFQVKITIKHPHLLVYVSLQVK